MITDAGPGHDAEQRCRSVEQLINRRRRENMAYTSRLATTPANIIVDGSAIQP